jgi:hypothetical protein
MSDWQPIEIAPRDGRELLVYWPYWQINRACTAYFDGRFGGWNGPECLSVTHEVVFPERQPTHWMPLPNPPTKEGNRS